MISYKEFEELYQDFYSTLMKILYGVTGSVEVSEDLCQEAFIRLYNNLAIFPSQQDAKYWLIRVAKNLAFNHCRRKTTERKVVERLQKGPTFVETTPADLLKAEEDQAVVQIALQRLPVKYRQVLVLKEYSQFSYAKIAKIEGISESNVKIRIFRARNMMEKILREEEGYVSK